MRIIQPLRGLLRRSRDTFDTWLNLPFFGAAQTAAGITVGAEDPITHETVLACYNVIAEGCAMLPAYLYQERGPSRRHATEHPLYELLLTSPCPHMTAFGFWKLVLFEKLHYGNHYSLVLRGGDGRIQELLPIENGRVQPFWYQDPEDGRWRRAYRVSAPGTAQAVFLEHEIFHISNMPILRGANYGLQGMSIWQMYQVETIGGALAINQFANRSLANGASMTGMLSVKPDLTTDTARELRGLVTEAYAGVENAGKIGVFGSEAKFTPMSQDNQKAQLLETRKYNRAILSGLLRVTPHLINDLEHGTFSNVEHLDMAHYKHCLRPHLLDICQTIVKDLLTPAERRAGFYVDHDEWELLRGDLKTMAEYLEKAVNAARMTPNEGRALQNLPPKDGGDELYINSAQVPLRLAAKGLGQRTAATSPVPDKKDTSDAA